MLCFSWLVFCFSCLICFSHVLSLKNKLSADTSSKVCHKLSADALKYAGSATPYEFVGNFDTKPFKFPGCIPVKMWSLVRHGSRTPTKKKMSFIKRFLPRVRHHILYNNMDGKSELPDTTIELFKEWSMTLPLDREKTLTEYGEKEIYELGRRFQKRFPQLIPDIYSKLHYKFRHTITHRTKLSAYNYALGIFGKDETNRIEFQDSLQDRFILKFSEYCRKWTKDVENKPERFIEHLEFVLGPEVEQVNKDITQRLGLNETLTYDEIRSMLHTCASEYVWNGSNSPWCHIFTEKDLQVMAYEADVKTYYRNGYGHELNYKQACPMVKDMLEYLMDDSSWPPVMVSFTHSGIITKFLAALKLYYDDEPLDVNFRLNRNWRTSKIDPFSSNFASVLYRCNNNENKVLTLYQEQPVTLPGCPDNDLCPLDVLIRYHNNTITNCNFDDICYNKKKKTKSKIHDDKKDDKQEEGFFDKILSIFD